MTPNSRLGTLFSIVSTANGGENFFFSRCETFFFLTLFACLEKLDRCLAFTENMGTDGQFQWQWSGPQPRKRPVAIAKLVPADFAPGTSRAPMGRREAPFAHQQSPEALRKREEREDAPVSLLIVRSQLSVARRRARKNVENPAKREVLALKGRAKVGIVEPGSAVCFVKPGPRRDARLGNGLLLCFPDKAKLFCAIEKATRSHKGRRLDHIEVVPRSNVWSA
jgi:hypothetical protein